MNKEQELKEIREAINAGNLTLQYLRNALQSLNSASNFGFADLLGLDLIGGIGKHMKISEAKEQLEMAKQQVLIFQKELKDVQSVVNLNVNISDFLTFADFFFDGLIADWFVQSRIGDAKNQLNDGIFQVTTVVERLRQTEINLI